MAILPGLIAVLSISVLSMLASSLHGSFDPLVLSIIFGILVSNLVLERELLRPGISFVLKYFLPLGIGFFGSQLNVTGMTIGLWPAVILVAALLFGINYLISRGLGVDKEVGLLLSTGIAICGASAIAVIAGLKGSKKENTSISVVSVMALGLTAMLLYSYYPLASSLGTDKFAFLAGTTLPMLGEVKVVSSHFGKDCMAQAVNFKLLKVSLLGVLAVVVLFFKREGGRFRIPWFVLLFLGLAAAVNLTDFGVLKNALQSASIFFLSATLAAVGLSLEFESVAEQGVKPLVSVFLTWVIMALLVFLFLTSL
jgi:uncharacterized integral membrane protein (TIGR00698 family)